MSGWLVRGWVCLVVCLLTYIFVCMLACLFAFFVCLLACFACLLALFVLSVYNKYTHAIIITNIIVIIIIIIIIIVINISSSSILLYSILGCVLPLQETALRQSSIFLCPLLSSSIPLLVAPQCHLSNDVLVFRLILHPLSATLCF